LPEGAAGAHRYAIYYAAPAESPLELFGTRWLGRNHRTGEVFPQPDVPGLSAHRLQLLTASPRRYGFHGTLKAPFRLADDTTGAALHEAAATFAAARSAFSLPPLVIADLKGFLAFVPSMEAGPLDALAAACVTAFEPFRAALSEAELARRLESPLSERQRGQLARFGYPYVFDDFSFHMTLTERLAPADKAILLPHLRAIGRELLVEPFVVDAIAVFEEQAPGADFVMTGRYPFGEA
jgi:putative phosphonate metabolism protein